MLTSTSLSVNNQKGFAPILILLAAAGLLAFLFLSNTFSFKDRLFNTLFPKPPSHAAEPSLPGEVIIKFKAGVPDEAKDNIRKAAGLEKKSEIDQIGVELDKVPDEVKDKIIEALSHNPRVEYAEPNILGESLDTPNDPSMLNFTDYKGAWHLYKIAAPAAWDISKGSSSVVVAVIDSGIDSSHEDFIGKLVPGYNYYDNNADTTDLFGHGTQVAGMVAAATNNGKGVASLGRDVMIMPVRAASSTGSASSFATAQSITFAVDHGAKIINISLGWGSTISSMQNAINYAWGKNVITVAATGNLATSPLLYPASEPIVVAVGMTDPSDTWIGSNYGTNLDVVAPGYNVYTTNKNGGYAPVSGSSFSSPLTAALAALIISVKPDLTPKQVTDIITQTTDKVGGVTYDSSGWNDHYGFGRINAYKALLNAISVPSLADTSAPSVSISSPSAGTNVSGSTVSLNVDATDNVGVTRVEVYIDGTLFTAIPVAPFVASWDTTTYSNSTHTISAKAYDNVGNVATSTTVTVTVDNPVSTPTPTPTSVTTPASDTTLSDTTPPLVSITSPVNGSIVKVNSTTNIQAQVSDNVSISKVEFYVNGSLKCTSTITPYTCSWKVPGKKNTNYTLFAKAYDTSNNTNSASVTIKAQ